MHSYIKSKRESDRQIEKPVCHFQPHVGAHKFRCMLKIDRGMMKGAFMEHGGVEVFGRKFITASNHVDNEIRIHKIRPTSVWLQ